MESIKKISKIIEGYSETMNKNHLIEEIRTYDRNIKEQDKAYLDKDQAILDKFSKGTSEFLSKTEMENLFSQQIRKIMSKHVKTMEKEIKINPAG